MMKTDAASLTLEKRKLIPAPVQRVFAAWTEPEQIKKWFGCGKVTTLEVSLDLRVGGNYSYECHTVDGETVTISGTFKEIEPGRKLVYTWANTSLEFPAKDTLVCVEFVEIDKKTTEIVVTHTNFAAPTIAEGHTMGWGDALEKFAALFENN